MARYICDTSGARLLSGLAVRAPACRLNIVRSALVGDRRSAPGCGGTGREEPPPRPSVALRFQTQIDFRRGERRVSPEVAPLHRGPVAGDNRLLKLGRQPASAPDRDLHRIYNTIRPHSSLGYFPPARRSCCGRMRFPGQLRRPPQPWRHARSCTNVQPGPPHGGPATVTAPR
jgi:hypothetical protein